MSNQNQNNNNNNDAAIMEAGAAEHRRLFYEAMGNKLKDGDPTTKPFKNKAYDTIHQIVSQYVNGVPLPSLKQQNQQAHKYVKKFNLIDVGGNKLLIYRQKEGEPLDKYKKVSYYNTVFDDIKKLHIPDHAKRNTLHKKCQAAFGDSIPLHAVVSFCDFCPLCITRRPRKKQKAGHQPIVINGFGKHGQVDLIDFQSMPDGPFNWLLVYQDHGIKLTILMPLMKKTHDAVAWALFKIFTLIGPPMSLQSDNGREFSESACGGKARMAIIDDAVRISTDCSMLLILPFCCSTPLLLSSISVLSLLMV